MLTLEVLYARTMFLDHMLPGYRSMGMAASVPHQAVHLSSNLIAIETCKFDKASILLTPSLSFATFASHNTLQTFHPVLRLST